MTARKKISPRLDHSRLGPYEMSIPEATLRLQHHRTYRKRLNGHYQKRVLANFVSTTLN
jgi:hypothetical protein